MQEFQRVVQAARPISELDPKTAMELDQQLLAAANMWTPIAEIFAAYAQNLERDLKVDPRVTAAFYGAVDDVGELHRAFHAVHQLWRRLYEKALEQMESDVRDIDRPSFWNQTAS